MTWEAAFNVEKVNNDFFYQYRELFIKIKNNLDKIIKKNERVKQEFNTKEIDVVNFTKKFLGQIVFLYFLQKKGWFGVKRDQPWGNGSKSFLRDLFKEHCTKGKKNYFNDVLEPLFYEALRRPRDQDYYSLFDCRIPFLNGGLFDPIENYNWVDIDILLPNHLFSNNNKNKQGDPGDGILDVFDLYNFTVKEDEPLDREVAIDPELLGKAYEKFNAITAKKFKEFQ